MDTISAGMTMAFAFECFEDGVITKEDTGGLELGFGDADLMIELLEMTARREGFGDLLAEGTARLAKQWGVDDKPCNMAVKGLEIAMHDPRVKVGVGIGYAVSTYGGDHMMAPHDPFFADDQSFAFKSVLQLGIYQPMPPTEISTEKVRTFAVLENFWRMLDALGLCVFGFAPRGVMPLDEMVQCLRAITGWETGMYELMASAERSSMIARAFNSREGFSIKDDRLPKRLFDPKPDGPNAGSRIFTEEDFNQALELYYEIIGCDPQTGRPHKGKLLELGLEWIDELLDA
jgi:aldehyde:ferredoxin oxidoreductase